MVPNNRVGRKKRAGEQISSKSINVQAVINVQVGIFGNSNKDIGENKDVYRHNF